MTRNTKVFAPPRHLQNSLLCPCRIAKISNVKKMQNSLFVLLRVFKHIHVLRQRRMLKNICSTQITWKTAHLRPALPEVPAPTRTYAEHVVPVHDNMFTDGGCVQLCRWIANSFVRHLPWHAVGCPSLLARGEPPMFDWRFVHVPHVAPEVLTGKAQWRTWGGCGLTAPLRHLRNALLCPCRIDQRRTMWTYNVCVICLLKPPTL